MSKHSALISAITDLIIEARYLSLLQHPHIIQLRAISNRSPYDYHHHYIILEKLNTMLSYRLHDWKTNHQQPNGITRFLFDTNGQKELTYYYLRLKYAYDIATALAYLHNHK
jgi:serine/threonine protein kinase